jgi:glutathione S-transferase
MSLTLIIGNKAYSSWSLRPWLALTVAGAEFEEVVVPLDQEDTADRLAELSPSRRVPVLKTEHGVLVESLAIIEYVAELYPAAQLWPGDRWARAEARAAAAEMHAGFAALRRDMPMDLKRRRPGVGHSAEALADAERVQQLWRDLRQRHGRGGDFLFGGFGAVDAMFAPVCTRFRTYDVPLDDTAKAYCAAIFDLPAFRGWERAAMAEPWILEKP